MISNKPSYQTGQQVIVFEDVPRLAWVAKGYYSCVVWAETHYEVFITFDRDDIRYGMNKNIAKVKPYTPELWAVCEAWIAKKTQLAVEFEELKRQRFKPQPGQAPTKCHVSGIDVVLVKTAKPLQVSNSIPRA